MAGAVVLQSVEVARAPGFAWNRFPRIEGLAPGLNVVWGPNGAGKTTLARTLRGLLWPVEDAASETVAEALAAMDGAAWRLSRNGPSLRQVRLADNHESQGQWGGADQAERYWFPLHELLRTEGVGGAFAQYIVAQMHGGSDLRAALALAEGTDRALAPNNPRVQAHKAAQAWRREVQNLHESQKDLRERLAEAEAAVGRARDAGTRLADLRRAMELLEARARLQQAEARLEAFPEGIARLSGDDPSRLEELVQARAGLEAKAGELRGRLAARRGKREALAVPRDLMEDESLRARIELWAARVLEREAARAASKQALLQAERAEAAWRGQARWLMADPPAASGLQEAVQRLRELAALCEPLRCALDAAARHRDALGAPEAAPAGGTAESWSALQAILKEWQRQNLRVAAGQGVRPRLAMAATAAGAAVAAAALVLGRSVSPSLAWLALLGPAAAALLLFRGASGARSEAAVRAAGLREQAERVLAEGGGAPPPEWTPEAVADLQAEAAQRAAQARALEARNAERTRAADEAGRAAAAYRRWLGEWREAAQRLGLTADHPDVKGAPFFHAGPLLQEWLGLVREAEEAKALDEAARTGLEEAVRALAALLGEAPGALAPADLGARAQELLARREAALRLAEQEEELGERLRALGAEMAALETRMDGFWRDRGYGGPDLDRLREEAGRVEDHRRALREREIAREAVAGREAGPARDLAEGRTLDQLREEARGLEEEASALEARSTALGALRKSFEGLVDGDALAQAMAREARELQALEQAKRENALARAVWIVAQGLEERALLEEQPAVLAKASAWFRSFTLNRYSLGLGADQAFFARDHVEDRTLRLEELSSGTRVQLLFAVRLGFIEEMEGPSATLPVFLDEVLANSDDERARAMIEAIRTIARTRQVFCFTAQRDELAKLEALAGPLHVVSLPDLEAERDRRHFPLGGPVPEGPGVPEPLEDYHAYGEACGVAGAQLFAPLESLHAWHFFTRSEELRELLLRGLARAGQALGAQTPFAQALDRRRGLLARAQSLAQAGRGRAFLAADFEAATIDGVKRDTQYWNALVAAAREAGEDGSAFRARLDGIPRLKAEQARAIEAWLLERRYASLEEPLDAEAILTLMSRESDALRVGSEERTLVERYLRQVLPA